MYGKLTTNINGHTATCRFAINIDDKIMFLDKQQAYNKNINGKSHEVLEKILVDYWCHKVKDIKENNK